MGNLIEVIIEKGETYQITQKTLIITPSIQMEVKMKISIILNLDTRDGN